MHLEVVDSDQPVLNMVEVQLAVQRLCILRLWTLINLFLTCSVADNIVEQSISYYFLLECVLLIYCICLTILQYPFIDFSNSLKVYLLVDTV